MKNFLWRLRVLLSITEAQNICIFNVFDVQFSQNIKTSQNLLLVNLLKIKRNQSTFWTKYENKKHIFIIIHNFMYSIDKQYYIK